MKFTPVIVGTLLFLGVLHSAAALAPPCAQTNCGAASCCDTTTNGGQCYNSSAYACNPTTLCPIMFPRACGTACYRDSEYTCSGTQLVQIPQGSTPTPSTQAPTQAPSTTHAPSTQTPTTQAPTTQAPTTQAPTTTRAPSTQAPTTQAPTTQAPTQASTTTRAPSTQAPTTQAPTTQAPTQGGSTPHNGFCASRTDCAANGLQCCETTHPANGETESECYDPTKFHCYPGVMCPVNLDGCGLSCFDDAYFTCNNGELVSKSKK